MTLSTTTVRASVQGSGITGPFSFLMKIFAATDLLVQKTSAAGVVSVLNYPTDYTVSGVGNASGGTLTLTVALAVGETLSILRAVPNTQPTSFRALGAFFPASHEDEFDRLTMLVQQNTDAIKRSARIVSSLDPAVVATEVTPSTGKVLGWASSTQLTNLSLDANAVAIPGQSRTVSTLSAYLANNAVFNVLDYGAIGNGVADDTAAVQAAVNAASTGTPSVVYFPPGYNVRITSTVTIATDGVQLVGGRSGKRNAVVTFDPPGSGSECFKWEKAAGLQVLYQCGVKTLMIQAAATTTRVKTAMHLRNCSEFEVDQVNIFEFVDTSHASVGVLMEGRELSRWRNFSVRADCAFHVKVCPDGSAIDFDHQTFENCYFSCDVGNTNTCFLIDPAVVVTNLAIRAFALVGFNNGIYWAAAPSNANSGVITIDGFRAEQATVATGYSIYLGAVSGTPRMITIENARLDPGRHGIYLRGLEQVVLSQIAFENNAGKTAIDVDGTCTNVRWNNFFTQAGSVASVASNLQYLTRGPKRLSGSPIPTDAVLQSTSVTEPPIYQVGELGGGGLNTQSGIQFNVLTATATTLVTLPNIQCTYLVSCVFRGTASTTAYGLALVICTGGGVYTVVNLGSGIWSFSTVGAALKVTQSSGGSLDCDWQISRYAFSRV